MIVSFLLALSAAPTAVAPATPRLLPSVQDDVDQEYQKMLADAGTDPDKLLALSKWCKANAKFSESRKALKAVLESDPENVAAHEGLNHHRYNDMWFESYLKLSDYKRAEEEEMRAKGLVRLGDEWVSAHDAPYLRMGWVKHGEPAIWMRGSEVEAAKVAADMTAKGWLPFDFGWVSPEDWKEKYEGQGQYFVGGEWLSKEAADAKCANIETPWRIRTAHFTLLTTLPRTGEGQNWVYPASAYADATVPDLMRIVGRQALPEKPTLVVLNSVEQYNSFATGDAGQGGTRQGSEISGYSSMHYAYLTEGWMDRLAGTAEYRGAGVGYWAYANDAYRPYGQHSIRFAAALAYLETLDPSWDAVSQMIAANQGPIDANAFWAQKKIPLWLRYGAASYCGRFFLDANADNPKWARSWALGQLEAKGGPRELAEVFAFTRDISNQAGMESLLSTAGALVSFVIDGNCKPVTAAHKAFIDALQSGADTAPAVEALQKAIVDNEEEFHVHIGM